MRVIGLDLSLSCTGVATDAGAAPKEAVLAAAIRRLGYGGSSHDEADAFWLRTMALDHYVALAEPVVPIAHRAVLLRIDWP